MDLAGRAALITGGGTGLGRAIALELARRGVNLALDYQGGNGNDRHVFSG